MEEPGGLQSMGSQRVRHDWATSRHHDTAFSLVAQNIKVSAKVLYAGDMGSIPGSRRSPGEGNGNPLQYSCLENPMDRGAWWATVHRVTRSWTLLSDFTLWISGAVQCWNGFLISAFKWVYLSFSPLLFTCLLCTAICKASLDSHFAPLHFFSLGMVLIPVSCTMSQTYIHSSSGTLSIRSNPLNLFVTSTVKL